ncbi:TPA: hypothetical protein ACX6S2_003462 [Photobacterium damselae]
MDTKISEATLRKRKQRQAKREAGCKDKTVTLSPHYQSVVKEIEAYTGRNDFSRLVVDLLAAYHEKLQRHQKQYACCGKCHEPYQVGGSCVLQGDAQCQYTVGGQRYQEMKP